MSIDVRTSVQTYRHFSIFELMWEHPSCKYLSDWRMRVEHGWAHLDIKGPPIIASRQGILLQVQIPTLVSAPGPKKY